MPTDTDRLVKLVEVRPGQRYTNTERPGVWEVDKVNRTTIDVHEITTNRRLRTHAGFLRKILPGDETPGTGVAFQPLPIPPRRGGFVTARLQAKFGYSPEQIFVVLAERRNGTAVEIVEPGGNESGRTIIAPLAYVTEVKIKPIELEG